MLLLTCFSAFGSACAFSWRASTNSAGATVPDTTFSIANYTDKKTPPISKLMASNSFLPESACNGSAATIGYILIPVGIWVAIGICTEFGLLAAGLVFLMLGFGLAALPDDTEVVSNIGLSILIVAAALVTSKAKTFSLDGILSRKKDA
jgi:uncharacterized membrane protein YphA (DoxX/SURF4 family)